ncbi:MAG: enoyl-ACP reductase [Chloroflexota bacterium]|nr:enoyl-ACP reductase [Chloroflexota bacterium]|tara:strand:+ start:229 stop:1002 length:774 start_codon:yes stop_codon:yes gene_type:complete
MYKVDLSGKTAVVFGIANQRSIAWSIAKILSDAGAKIIATYQNERVEDSVSKLTSQLNNAITVECDVSDENNVKSAFETVKENCETLDIVVHSIAFAQRDDLGGRFIDTDREGFRLALDISAYSLVSIARNAAPLMTNGGSMLTMSFMAAERVFPGYNVMSTAKAALENEVRQIANDLGPDNIRVNAISAGPLDTLSSRVISGYRDMKKAHSDRAPMKRNITHDEVASTALYLSSNMSSGVTGEVIHVDTGYHVMGI